MKGKILLCACLLAASCSKGENEPGPGGVTVGEARALDEAAQMLDERRLPPQDLRQTPPSDAAPAASSVAQDTMSEGKGKTDAAR